MNINWVLADSASIGPEVDLSKLKGIGSLWGGWRSWRACQTDNVICYDQAKASELIKRKFYEGCNFYIPNSVYQSLDRPDKVRIFEGEFIHELDHYDEIIAMHLAAGSSDIILMLGFDLSEPIIHADKLTEHRAINYRALIKQVIMDNDHIQWVLVDHPAPIMKEMSNLENLSSDIMDTVLTLSSS